MTNQEPETMSDHPIELREAVARVEAFTRELDDLERRFRRYHAEETKPNGSVWDKRADEEAQRAADIRLLLALVSPSTGWREALARAIDPRAYEDFPIGGEEPEHDWWDREQALWKADAALARLFPLSASPLDGGEER